MPKDKQYQDEWVKGRVVSQGYRECAARYEMIRRFVDAQFTPGFSVLDFGAFRAYFSLRLSEEFEASCVAVDPNPLLEKAVQKNREPPNENHRVTVVSRKYHAPEELEGLGRFDLVLVLSVLHHIPRWREFIEQFKAQARWLIVEPTHPEELAKTKGVDVHLIDAHVRSMQGVVKLGEAPTVWSAPQGARRSLYAIPGYLL